MMTVSTDEPLYRQVYESLRGRITSGELAPESRLPTESALAGDYGVSLITVRQAQKLLVDEGLIVKQRGRGSFVTPRAAELHRLLWVCGVVADHGEAAPYYFDSQRFCQEAAAAAGFGFEALWLPSRGADPEEARQAEAALDRYAGILFDGCPEGHPLRRAVRRRHRRHAVIGRLTPEPNCVSRDVTGALHLALEALADGAEAPVEVFGLPAWTRALDHCAATRLPAHRVHELPEGRRSEVERAGYYRARELLTTGALAPRVCILDDMLARGVTRALLEQHGGDTADLRVSVICGRAEAVPLGLPVTWVLHDPRVEAAASVDIVRRQMQTGAKEVTGVVSSFALVPDCLDPQNEETDTLALVGTRGDEA